MQLDIAALEALPARDDEASLYLCADTCAWTCFNTCGRTEGHPLPNPK